MSIITLEALSPNAGSQRVSEKPESCHSEEQSDEESLPPKEGFQREERCFAPLSMTQTQFSNTFSDFWGNELANREFLQQTRSAQIFTDY